MSGVKAWALSRHSAEAKDWTWMKITASGSSEAIDSGIDGDVSKSSNQSE